MSRSTRRECPECGAHDTEQVHVEWYANYVDEVRFCNDCPTSYTLTFAAPTVTEVR
jgi:hypothetical protein